MEPMPERNTFSNTPAEKKIFYKREELWWYICMVEDGINPRQVSLHDASSKLNWGWWWSA